MTAEAEAKISRAIEKELDSVDKHCMRPLQVKAFMCSAKCCEDRDSSQGVVQGCLQNCMKPMLQAEDSLKNEINQFQERLTRCSQACQDVFKDSLSSSGEPTPHQIEKAQTKAEQCIVQCADTHIPLIPKLIAKFKFSASCYLN